ncbi:phage tail tape measure protein [Propionibacterium freudenreichii]|uniref:phage tail tape measure protein n=1 Tax=Propionibacterium freudenreichii TaxID=1744 RepID=UPI0021A6BB6D|nr:phage tail tape measure protein [Propionibacterium freudenreichii]MCT2983700.1 hypothetical protein [Propionibacterium freudenreichii]
MAGIPAGAVSVDILANLEKLASDVREGAKAAAAAATATVAVKADTEKATGAIKADTAKAAATASESARISAKGDAKKAGTQITADTKTAVSEASRETIRPKADASGVGKEVTGKTKEAVAEGSRQVVRPKGDGDSAGKSIAAGLKSHLGAITGVISGALASGAVVKFGSDAVNSFKDAAGAAMGLARNLGTTTEDASRLSFAAKMSGVNTDTFANSMKLLEKNIGDVSGKSGAAAGVLSSMGVSVRDASGNMRPMAQLLPDIAEKFKGMPDGADKTATAIKIFGRSGADMVPMLNKGKDGMADLMSQSDKFGATIGKDGTDAFKKSVSSQREWNASLDGLKVSIGSQILPIMTTVMNMIRQKVIPAIVDVTKFVTEHKSEISSTAKVLVPMIAVITGVGGALVMIGKVAGGVKATAGAVKLLGTAFKDMSKGTVIGLIVTGITLVVSALAALYKTSPKFRAFVNGIGTAIKNTFGAVIGWFTGSLVPGFKKVWGTISDVFKTAGRALGTAFKAVGDVFSSIAKGIGKVMNWLWKSVIQPVWNGIKVAISIVVTIISLEVRGWILVFQKVVAPVFTWLWQHIVKPAFEGISNAIKSVVDWFKNSVAPVFKSVGKAIGDAFTGLRDAVGNAWNWIKDHIIEPVVKWFETNVIARFKQAIQNAKDNFANFRDNLSDIWNWVKDHIIDPVVKWFERNVVDRFKQAIQNAKDNFANFRDKLGEIWNWIKDHIINPVVEWFERNVVDRFVQVKNSIVDAFNAVKDGVGKAWDAMKELAAKPIRFVVNTVVAGLVGKYNDIAGMFGAPKADVPHVDFATGGVLPGYTPGRDVHSFVDPRTGMLLNLSGGEAVMRPEFTAAVGPEWVARMNALAKSGGVGGLRSALGFADGGVMSFAGGGVIGAIKGVASGIGDFLKDPIGALKKVVQGFEDKINSNPFGRLITRVPGKIISTIGDWVKEHLGGLFGGNTSKAAQDWAPQITAALQMLGIASTPEHVQAWVRQIQTESGGNPNAIQGNIGDVNNASGDLAKGLVQVIGATFSAYHVPGFDNVFDGMSNILAGMNYAKSRYGGEGMFGVIGQGHGYAGGGVLPRLYDAGGWLPTGTSVVRNETGRPERILGPSEGTGGTDVRQMATVFRQVLEGMGLVFSVDGQHQFEAVVDGRITRSAVGARGLR